MPDADYIFEQIKKAQLQDGVFVPYGYRGRPKNKPPIDTAAYKFMNEFKNEFKHIANKDWHKWQKIFVNVDNVEEFGLDHDMVLIRLAYIFPTFRREGLSALLLRCLKECADASGCGLMAFSNPVEFVHNYSAPQDLITGIRADSVKIEYQFCRDKQQRTGYKLKESGYERIDFDDTAVVDFCDKFSSYVYIPEGFDQDLFEKVIKPRLHGG
jgi:hypothetical protein